MTPRERILTALSHQPPDRTPTDGWFHPEVTEMLKRHYRTDDWAVVPAELVDDLIEIGIDVLNPIQPECMDPVEVKRWWGPCVATRVHGSFSYAVES